MDRVPVTAIMAARVALRRRRNLSAIVDLGLIEKAEDENDSS
jgi:hypothetical protein